MPLAPPNTNFEGGASSEKRDFLFKIFQNGPKNVFFELFFFQNFAYGGVIWAKTGSLWCFGRARKLNMVDLTQVDQILEFFLKVRPN